MERKELIFAENYIIHARWCWGNLTTKLPCSSPIFLLGWFGSFALLNIQAFSNNKVTIKITISARLHLFCFSCHCLSVSVLKYLRCVNEYFAGFVASYLCLAE